uniref:PHD-type domain-containing protein n=1 Tax=Leersia perrieri TaxID=77586 RepID=A0A0D9WN48_9ORYZ
MRRGAAAAAAASDRTSRRALTLRSPFDSEEAAGRDALLPARVARWAAVGDVRKKHKKAQPPEAAAAAAAVVAEQPKAGSGLKEFWDLMEPYFREITLDDIEAVMQTPFLGFNGRLDPCFLVPFVGSGKEFGENYDPSCLVLEDESSHLNSNLGKDNDELESNIVHSKQDVNESSDFVGGNMELVINNGTNDEHGEQDMQEVVLQEEQPMEIEQDHGSCDAIALPPDRKESDASLNWLLGSRDRFVLTSDRPNKKRKLLGADAGLERLVKLPSMEGEAVTTCDVCCLGESGTSSNKMLHCSSCEVSVHQKCYGVHVVPDQSWSCTWCRGSRLPRRQTRSDAGRTVLMPCVLCPKEKGALKPVKRESGQIADGGNLKFVHLFCSLWSPEVVVEDLDSMEPVTNVGDIQENRTKLVCSLCKVMHGACIRCSHGACRTCFHPICARESKHQMEIWGKTGNTNVEMRAFCLKHSTVQETSSIQSDKIFAEGDTSQIELDDASLVTQKKQLRFTRNNKDKFTNSTIASSCSSSLNKQTTELATSPSTARSVESQETQITDMAVDRPIEDRNVVSNSTDVSTALRKLIDQGLVNIGDIESELGVSSESLEAALVPETSTFSPGLKLKIIKLLQNSVRVPSVQVKYSEEGSLAPQGESKSLTDTQICSELEEGISSFDHCCPEGDNTNKDWADSVENGFHNFGEDDVSGHCFLNQDGSRCYVHPFVEKKLRILWDHNSKQNNRPIYRHVEQSTCAPHGRNVGNSSTELEQLADIAAADQVSKAKSSGILEHSPHDEIEGEILYLQSRLLNDVGDAKQRYEDLLLKIVQGLSDDLDSFNKRKWDHIIANQFLRDLREAKKRGNTERRHKEAQAIMAAAAPYILPTSQNSSVRKSAECVVQSAKQESVPDVLTAKQENIPKFNSGTSRVSQLISVQQANDSSPNSKISADDNIGIFDLQKFSKKNALPCDICMRCETVLNRIFVCSSCKAAVHLDCYRSVTIPTGPWKCELCQEMPSDAVAGSPSDCNGAKPCLAQCNLCHGTSGAFRKTIKGQWVHAFCAEWMLESMFTRGQYNAVDGMEGLRKDKDTCSICNHNVGACLKCSIVDCQVTFHPACARDAGFYMDTKKVGRMLQHKAYCGKHGIEQRKADLQLHGPEEVKNMKQMRVKLEILRLICERIVKREKLKKDLVVCEHDILASRRNSVASSTRTSYCGSGLGASSESATTSVNNSYSGIMQRSDDVAVDSIISRKPTVRFSLHNSDADRNTTDSSTSSISYKQKLDDRESFADKNLPKKPVTAMPKSEEGEIKPLDKKNQRPPKSIVYTRRSALSKKKQLSLNVEGPGG